MKRICMFCAALLVTVSGLFSQESSNNSEGENYIAAISVSGLKRTKPHIIERPLQRFIGQPTETIDTNEVIAVLKGFGAVEPLSVEIEDGKTPGSGSGKVLAVIVREKWSVFPIPFFGVSSSSWAAGGAFMDTNVFGLNDTMMLVGSYGTGGWMANVMFIDTPNAVGDFGWSLMGMFFYQDKESTDQRSEILRRFNSVSINPAFGVSYKLAEWITPNITVSYRNVLLRDKESSYKGPKDGVQGITFSPGIAVQRDTWDGYFLNGINASLKYSYTFVIGEDDVHALSLNAAVNRSIIPRLRFISKTAVIFATPSSSPFFESSSVNSAVSILPQTYSAVDFSGISVGLEQFLCKFSFASVSLSAAYQAAYSNGELLRNQFDHGALALLQMYFSKAAIPGMGLGAAYNADKNVWRFAFNLGMML
jgi:outer membrane protein assembly factor BamA